MMVTIRYIIIIVLFISFFTFVIFFGKLPRLRNTPIGWSYRAIWIHIPSRLRAVDQKLTDGRIYAWVLKQVCYLWNDRHPLVLIFFILLLGVSEYMFLPPAWPLLSTAQKVKGLIAIILPWIFLYLAAASDPGYISQLNHHDQMALYPYDFSIFYPGQTCRTCHFLKPARSKHCSICKRCISKFDHHCIFINNCVGYRNHHFFILLVSTTALLTNYASYVGISLLSAFIQKELPAWTLRGKGYTWAQYSNILAWAFNKQVRIGAVTLLCFLCSPLVMGLLLYHLYLIWAGTTTNETLKWSDLRADMEDGYAFKRSLTIDRQKNERYEPLLIRWPYESDHIITRSYDGRPPNPIIIGTGEWERIWRLADISNLYDLGFIKNLLDVLWPGYPFRRVAYAGKSFRDPNCELNSTA